MKKSFNYKHFALVPVECEVVVPFLSANEKLQFIDQHFLFPDCTYDVYNNHASEYLFYVIDLSFKGFILNKDEPLKYADCMDLINHYL